MNRRWFMKGAVAAPLGAVVPVKPLYATGGIIPKMGGLFGEVCLAETITWGSLPMAPITKQLGRISAASALTKHQIINLSQMMLEEYDPMLAPDLPPGHA